MDDPNFNRRESSINRKRSKDGEEGDNRDSKLQRNENQAQTPYFSDSESEEFETDVWDPSVNPMEEGDVLEYDPSTYNMLHTMDVEWPCLSFDVLVDSLGMERTRFPHTAYFVAGSQADVPENNKIFVMKASGLGRTDMVDSEDSDDDEPILVHQTVPHVFGGINKIRAMPTNTNIVATFCEDSSVYIWDIKKHVNALDKPPKHKLESPDPIFQFSGHSNEGWALDWSQKKIGRLASGDCDGNIFLWDPTESSWVVDSDPFVGHDGSIEDIKFSPVEADIFSSCSVDQTIKFWDARTKAPVSSFVAHDCDVNVMSWNQKRAFLFMTGADDGTISVWDLRKIKEGGAEPLWSFTHHKQAITSLEWNSADDACFAASSEDNSISFWDLSIAEEGIEDNMYPPQLLFIHRGQNYIKDIHFHIQIPNILISTSHDGFNILKPISI